MGVEFGVQERSESTGVDFGVVLGVEFGVQERSESTGVDFGGDLGVELGSRSAQNRKGSNLASFAPREEFSLSLYIYID